MTTPRPIEPSEIRVGDKVRRTESLIGDDIRTYEFTVADRCVNSISSRHARYETADATWTLLDRPEPPREPGSRWRDALEVARRFPSLTADQCHSFAVNQFRHDLRAEHPEYPSDEEIRAELAGKDLACWCKPTEPCHADVLLEIANGEQP